MENEIAFNSMLGRVAHMAEIIDASGTHYVVDDAAFISAAQHIHGSNVVVVTPDMTVTDEMKQHPLLFLNDSGNVYDVVG